MRTLWLSCVCECSLWSEPTVNMSTKGTKVWLFKRTHPKWRQACFQVREGGEERWRYATENSRHMIWNLNVKGTKMSPRKSTWLKVNSKKREKLSQSCQSCILLLEYSVDPKAFPYKDYFELKFMQSYSSRVQEWKYGARINLVTEIIRWWLLATSAHSLEQQQSPTVCDCTVNYT